MKAGDYVKVTMFRGEKLTDPMWVRVVEAHSDPTIWWGGVPLCGPPVGRDYGRAKLYNRDYTKIYPVGFNHSGEPDEWEVVGPEPPDEYYAAMARHVLSE